jgi:hypothetical protein
MPVWIQWVTFSLAIISLLMSSYALKLNHDRTSIIKRKEKERLEKRKKAKFSIERTKQMGSKRLQDIFVLTNEGESEARNVNVTLFNKDRDNGETKECKVLMDRVPELILSGQAVKVLMAIHGGTAGPWEVVIKWDDDFEDNREHRVILN